MIIQPVNDSPAPAARRGNLLPAPVHDSGNTPQTEAHKRAMRGFAPRMTRGRLVTPLAPFLAQLSLQYDGIAVARRTRFERNELAALAYADMKRLRPPVSRSRGIRA